ncbi:uncharacterized protein B0H18DRAFT_965183 [Fomitopsis serialis]|uniref:uncharacterized protein n=1 Tax=Fomitopsis serialis TaxID=139415 RepID=UPI0020085341|nr:uncharacterized protein B0H18DRAFT_965183 [Neoantrodia serialis]KAH9938037.1 hypothetical protein B0H18DRAFT_965183 [Neoantrodia serialis]
MVDRESSDSESDSDSDSTENEQENGCDSPPIGQALPSPEPEEPHTPPRAEQARSSDDLWESFEAAVASQAEDDAGRTDQDRLLSAGLVETLTELRTVVEEHERDDAAEGDAQTKGRVVIGLLKRLSDACKRAARANASTRVLAFVYDNINMLFRIAEARMGSTGKDAQQNGTCATAFALYDADPEDMLTSDYMSSLAHAPPLTLRDILLTPTENTVFTELMQQTVLSIVINYGGPAFARFKSAADPSSVKTAVDCKIPVHTTDVFPLPTMEIDESTIVGNAEVTKSMFSAVGLDMASDTFTRTVKLIAGDQLSIARIRSLTRNRAGHDSFANSYLWAVVMPGIFHYKMAATHGFMELHYGRNTSPGNPGSLAFHNNLLDRKPIVLTSLPSFRESRDLIFVSLYARVLRCLELVSGSEDLTDYAQNTTLERLQEHCAEIVRRFTDGKYVDRLRTACNAEKREYVGTRTAAEGQSDNKDIEPDGEPDDVLELLCHELIPKASTSALATTSATTNASTTNASATSTTARANRPENEEPHPHKPTQGDIVLENAILFLRDALIMRLLTDTVKCGDSGRLVLVLKVLALYYRGCGRNKYALEVLFLIHNLEHVWPEPLRKIILNNWLVNPTGKANAWVEVDLLQEHFNFLDQGTYLSYHSCASALLTVKQTIYKAHGSNASWDWLAMISPCIDILRRLASQMHTLLGAKQGTSHTSPSLDKDISQLVASLRRFCVYELQPGREVDDGTDDSGQVADSLTQGLQRLSEPLDDFNRTFRKLQSRCKAAPLLGARYSDFGGGESRETVDPQNSPASLEIMAREVAAPADGAPDPDDSGSDDEDFVNEDEPEDLEPQAFMSLETAGDVALDMDIQEDFVLDF